MNKNSNERKYDLEERTAKFAENVIKFCKKIKETTITKTIVYQLVKAATSVAANYCEADDAESKKDFKHKIGICKKESREVKYWFRMLKVARSDLKSEIQNFWQEAKELNLIFNSINNKLK